MIYKLEFREGSSMYVKEEDIQDIEGGRLAGCCA